MNRWLMLTIYETLLQNLLQTLLLSAKYLRQPSSADKVGKKSAFPLFLRADVNENNPEMLSDSLSKRNSR